MDTYNAAGLERHPTLYFDNGDIAITAKLPDGAIQIYRVDRAFLSRYSCVFADMFSLPTPHTIDTIDDVPVVHLSDDALDVTALLEVLYDPSRLIFKPRDPNNPLIAARLLRLSTKYDIVHVTNAVKRQVCADWPVTFEDYEREYAVEEAIKQQHSVVRRVQGKALDDVLPEPASAIRLAMDFDIPSILPAAFLALSSRHPDVDWDDVRELSLGLNDWDMLGVDMVRTARWSLLSASDHHRLHQARCALVIWQHSICESVFYQKALKRCNECQAKLTTARNTCCRLSDNDYLRPDPLAKLQSWRAIVNNAALCISCRMTLEKDIRKNMMEFWEELDCIFRLSS